MVKMTGKSALIKSSEIKENEPLDSEFLINTDENLELTLNRAESMTLINLLKKGPNEKARNFSEAAIEFYQKMKQKEEIYRKSRQK